MIYTVRMWLSQEVKPEVFYKAFKKRFSSGLAAGIRQNQCPVRPTEVHDQANCFEIALSWEERDEFFVFLKKYGKKESLELRELPGFNLGLLQPSKIARS